MRIHCSDRLSVTILIVRSLVRLDRECSRWEESQAILSLCLVRGFILLGVHSIRLEWYGIHWASCLSVLSILEVSGSFSVVVFPVSNEELWYHRLYEIIQFNRLVTLTFGFGCLFLFVMGLQLIQQIQFIFVYANGSIYLNSSSLSRLEIWLSMKRWMPRAMCISGMARNSRTRSIAARSFRTFATGGALRPIGMQGWSLWIEMRSRKSKESIQWKKECCEYVEF